MYEYTKDIEAFLKTLKSAEENTRVSKDTLIYEDKLLQDILHKLELDDLKYSERAKLATQLKNSRKNRRRAKDTIEFAEPILEWLENNKKPVEQLKQVLGKLRKIKELQETRQYTPRIKNGGNK